MKKFIPLEEETGKFIYTRYGMSKALVFQGDEGFLFRCDNLIHNFSPERGEFHRLDEITAYVIINEESVKAGLKLYFHLQICQAGEENDVLADALAAKRANKFWAERIIQAYFPIFILEDGFSSGWFYPYGVTGKKAKAISLKEY